MSAGPAIETTLQAALRRAGGARLQVEQGARLQSLQRRLEHSAAAGLPPADYAFVQRLLRMLAAAQQVLQLLPVAVETAPPAFSFPSLPPFMSHCTGDPPWPPPAPSRPPPG